MRSFSGSDPSTASESYERYFVPAIGAPLAADLIEVAELRSGERVLDVACGTGVVARLAAERVGPEGCVAGIDVNPEMLAVARSVTPAIEWHEMAAETMPLPEDTWDVALCQMGLQFFDDRSAALRRIKRVLAPGGRVVVSVPGPTPEVFVHLAEGLARHVAPELAGFVNVVFSLHDPDELRELLTASGFEGVSTSRTNRTLRLPAPADFLWQYVHSTPLVAGLAGVDDRRRAALEGELVAAWQPFTQEGALTLEVGVTYAVGHEEGSGTPAG